MQATGTSKQTYCPEAETAPNIILRRVTSHQPVAPGRKHSEQAVVRGNIVAVVSKECFECRPFSVGHYLGRLQRTAKCFKML